MTSGVLALRRSGLLQICVELYQQHHDNGNGWCACGRPLVLCAARANCVRVFAAAGLQARRFDTATAGAASDYLRADLTEPTLARPGIVASTGPQASPGARASVALDTIDAVLGAARSSATVREVRNSDHG